MLKWGDVIYILLRVRDMTHRMEQLQEDVKGLTNRPLQRLTWGEGHLRFEVVKVAFWKKSLSPKFSMICWVRFTTSS